LLVVNGPEFTGSGFVSGFVISLVSKQLIEAFSPNGQGFSSPHDVAVSTDGSQAYVVELDSSKVWKFVKGKQVNQILLILQGCIHNNFLLNL
jgi:DNA-binding beta-propeller fold protein YncE